MFVSVEHWANANCPILVKWSGSVTDSRWVHCRNALVYIIVTVFGISTVFRKWHFSNAKEPMPATVYVLPSISTVSGMVIFVRHSYSSDFTTTTVESLMIAYCKSFSANSATSDMFEFTVMVMVSFVWPLLQRTNL